MESLRLVLVLCLCAALISLDSVVGFNVDMENFVRYQGPPDSMFGFSVAEYRGWDHSWVLVGAPAAQTEQPGVQRGGAVFRCDSSYERCQMVTFDPSGNTRNSSGHEIDKKSKQWFGATVHTSGAPDGVIVACAPRYTYFSQSAPEYREDPVGTCYVARDNFRTFLEYSPCRTSEWGYHRQGSCQAGLGAAVSKDGQRLFIGAPGSWYWQGRLYSVNSKVKLDWFYPIYNFSYPPGRLYSQNLNEHLRPDVITTLEGPKEDDDSYLGYSVAGGDFTGDGDNGAAVGMPRGAMLFGKVILFSSRLTNIGEFRGEQLGAYFGYSVCVADVDGDNLDDLIVGAPMFTHLHNNEGKYETGRIHIMYQKKESKWFEDSEFRDGKNSKSRFGLSLCSLGDINKDGFGDIAVGAPYDGPKGGGAVYVYHGSEKGLMKDPSQIIYGETFSQSISTFGFSISGGNDLDNNEYPDIVVGAYEKDLAFFFKSRPIIKMKSDIKVGPESKLISLDDKNCVLRDRTLTTCTSVNLCMEYNGIGVEPRHEFEVQLTLDSKKQKGPRMFFRTEEGLHTKNFTVLLDQGNRKCNKYDVYIKPGIKDKLTALEVEMRYETRYNRRRPPRSLLPILDQGRPAVEHDSISIQKNCGPDNICIPDLNLSATPSVSKYLLGSGERFDIEAKVVNYGEDAFESIFNLRIPPGLNFTRIERLPDDDREIPVQCSAPDAENNNTLKCDIGNPLPKHKHVHFKVLMQPFYKENLKSRYEFYVDVNSTNPENKSSTLDNKQEFSVPIIINSDISITGSSSPIDLYYNTTHYNVVNVTQESEIGPQLNHSYTIFNTGPSDIVEAEVYILWPMYTLQGEPLFYILEQPEVVGPAVCEKLEEANSLQLQLDHRRKSGSKQAHTGKLSKSSESGRRITVKETSHSKGSATSSGKWKDKNFEERDKATDTSKSKSNGRDFSTSHEHQNAGAKHGFTRNENEQSYFQNESRGGWSDESAKDGQFHGYSSYNYSYSISEGGKPTKHYSNYSVTTYGDGSQTGSSANWSSENADHKHSNIGFSDTESKQKTSSFSGSSSEITGSSLGGESQTGGVRFIPAIKRTGAGHNAVTVSGRGGFQTGVIDSHGGLNPFSTNTGTSHHTTLDNISGNSQEGSHYYSSTWSNEGSSRSESGRKQSNTDNSKQIVRHYSSTTGNDGEVRHYNPSTDIAWEERYRHTIDSGRNTQAKDDDYDNDDDDLDEEYDESYSEEHTTNTNNNRDSETDKNFKLYSRYTRDVNGEDNFDQLLECNSTKCVKFKCSIKRFTRGQEININIRSRVWVQTLKKISFNVPANVSSMLAMQVTKLPYIGRPDNPIIRSLEVFTTVISTDTTIKPDIVPLWVVVLSACAGAIILLLLILLLWKCGFFKRNRPTDAPEKEPLNRNGHYSNGDEAL